MPFCVLEEFIQFDTWDIWSYSDKEKEEFILVDTGLPLSWSGGSCDRKKVAHLKIWRHVDAEQRHDGEHGECQRPTTTVTVVLTKPYLNIVVYFTTLLPYPTVYSTMPMWSPYQSPIFSFHIVFSPLSSMLQPAVETVLAGFDKCFKLLHTEWKPQLGGLTNAHPWI